MAKSFFVIGPPRTGTNMVTHTLRSRAPEIFCFNEVFNRNINEFENEQVWGHSVDEIHNLFPDLSIYISDLNRLSQRFEFPEEIILSIFSVKNASSIKSIGIKFLYDHLFEISNFVRILSIVKRIDPVILHIRRKDILAQYYSLKIAERTGEWVRKSTDAKKDEHCSLEIWIPDLLIYFGALLEQERMVTLLFNNFNVIDVWYEDIVGDPTGIIQTIADVIGYDDQDIPIVTKKQNTFLLSNVIKNYSEVLAVLEHTTIWERISGYFDPNCFRAAGSDDTVKQYVAQWPTVSHK